MKVVLALAVVSAVLIQSIGAWQDSQTTDEAVHLAAGILYWRDQAWLFNPEHPPLIKLAAGLPLVPLVGLSLPSHVDRATEPNQWYIGAQLLYEQPNLSAGRWLLFFARLPMILLWGCLAWLIYYWAAQWWHPVAGAAAAILFLMDPNFLGHGHLIATDVAAALGYTAVIYVADRYWRQPSRKRLWLLAIVFGLAQITKFSLLWLWLVVPLLGLIRRWTARQWFSWRQWWTMIGALWLASSLIIWASYGFTVMRPAADPRVTRLWQERQQLATNVAAQPPFLQHLLRWTDPKTSTGKFVRRVFQTPLPAYPYWRGVSAIISHNNGGHGAYLWGQAGYTGWWWYFPVAVLFKTPLIILLGGLVMVIVVLRQIIKRKSIPWSAWVLGLPPLLYFLWSLTSHINIGLRHIFPIYPFLYLTLGWLFWRWWQRGRLAPVFIIGVLALNGLVAFNAYPNTIGYFNALAGGTNGGHRYLLDSNLDWNQDIWRLRAFLHQHQMKEYQLSVFGSIPENRVFPEGRRVPTTVEIQGGRQPSGIIVISANRLYNPNASYRWLESYQPRWRLGSSIYVYDFR